jgi:LacI family transcriptional regulator, fructose operon transcriptional repressor
VKLTDIARLAGVSVTTASYVINGKAQEKRISPLTVERVMGVVKTHGYRPDQHAAGLRRGSTRTLGLIIPDLENPSYAKIAKCLERLARGRGYQLLIASSDDDPETELQVLALFRARRCDGLIVATCLPQGDTSYLKVIDDGTPVVAVDRAMDAERVCSIVSDDHEAAAQLTQTLLSPSPRHIALIGARPELPISQARTSGFKEALEAFAGQVTIREAAQFSRECGAQQMRAFGDAWPDAIITTAYVLLEGVLDVLREHDRLDGGHVHLATFGDTQLLDFLPLRVNAIYQQHERIAERALETVVAAIEEGAHTAGVEAIPRRLKLRQ